MRSYLITGVSSGIGLDIAKSLLDSGHRVFGSTRAFKDSEQLKSEFPDSFIPLQFDVTNRDEVNRSVDVVRDVVGEQGLHGLVNSAGISIAGPLIDIEPELMRRHFETNVMGVFHTIQAFFPLLRISRNHWGQPGRIVNVSALSGRNAYPFMGPYAASKHALEALSDSLRREMMVYGVDVIVIQPGNIDTPIWEKSKAISTDYAHTDYASVLERIDTVSVGKRALPVSKVTNKITLALMRRRPRARYVIPDDWFKFWIVPRTLPDRWFDYFVDRFLNFKEIRKRLNKSND